MKGVCIDVCLELPGQFRKCPEKASLSKKLKTCTDAKVRSDPLVFQKTDVYFLLYPWHWNSNTHRAEDVILQQGGGPGVRQCSGLPAQACVCYLWALWRCGLAYSCTLSTTIKSLRNIQSRVIKVIRNLNLRSTQKLLFGVHDVCWEVVL